MRLATYNLLYSEFASHRVYRDCKQMFCVGVAVVIVIARGCVCVSVLCVCVFSLHNRTIIMRFIC